MSIIDRFKKVKERRTPITLTVKSAVQLTENMRRVTLHGPALSDFPQNAEGAYIKLLFCQEETQKTIMRTYTVSQQRVLSNEIDIDFVLHEKKADNSVEGLAASWALKAKAGDIISIAGPGPASFINQEANYLIFLGDMSALPAICANLKNLQANAVGKVIVEVLGENDIRELPLPPGMELEWIINQAPGGDNYPLLEALKTTNLTKGEFSAWLACEYNAMKKLRQYLKKEKGVERSHLYASSYWKKGSNEEQHKQFKQEDAKTIT